MRKLVTIIAFLCAPALLWAGGSDEVLQPQFKFRHQEININKPARSALADSVNPDSQQLSTNRSGLLTGKLNQFDATISYPFTPRQSVNLDLGVNLRFINGELFQNELNTNSQRELNATLPMFYASALFELPFQGLSASFGASHLEYDQYYALDYRAKLSYQWQNGLGLEGGWQHQQLSIDGGSLQADIENKGMFLDLKYRF